MNIQLASGVFAERVGDTVVLMDSRTHQVYSLPTGIVTDVSGNTLTLSPLATADHIHDLAKHQLIDLPPAPISRRGLLGLTTAAVGGGLVAMSMPTVAAASSLHHQPVATNGYWNWQIPDDRGSEFSVFLLNSEFPELAGVLASDVSFEVNLGAGVIVTVATFIVPGTVNGQPARWWGSGFVNDATKTRMVELSAHPSPPLLSAVGRLDGVKFADLTLEGLFTTWPTVPNFDGFGE